MLHCLGIPEQTFLDMQRKAKEYASIPSILQSFKKKAELFEKKFKLRKNTVDNVIKHINLSLGASRPFTNIFKSALFSGQDLMKDPIFSSILYSV